MSLSSRPMVGRFTFYRAGAGLNYDQARERRYEERLMFGLDRTQRKDKAHDRLVFSARHNDLARRHYHRVHRAIPIAPGLSSHAGEDGAPGDAATMDRNGDDGGVHAPDATLAEDHEDL